MEAIADLYANMPKSEPLPDGQHELKRVEWMNSIQGRLQGYDCEDCLNRGYMSKLSETLIAVSVECHCMKKRRSLKMIEKSGLSLLLERCTFENYITASPWQKAVKGKALDYLADDKKRWFAILGQTGSGKTHICTAIAASLLNQGKPTRYALWNTEVKKLRSTVNDGQPHEREIDRLKTIEALYIDDLFKSKKGSEPSDADVRLAFEVLNARYNAELITIISSELSLNDISAIDTAIAGRINEMGGRYVLNIADDPKRNYRWRGDENATPA